MLTPLAPQDRLQSSLEEAGLSERIVNILKKRGIVDADHLSLYTEKRLMLFRGISYGSLGQIRKALAVYDATLREEPESVFEKAARLGVETADIPVDALPLRFKQISLFHDGHLHTLQAVAEAGTRWFAPWSWVKFGETFTKDDIAAVGKVLSDHGIPFHD